MSTVVNSTNIFWQECPVGKLDRQKLLNQKGCVVWITGLSGSGKSTLASLLSRELHSRGKLSYVLDGDNLQHGLNKDLGSEAEDCTEFIRRVGEVAKLFADAGLICVASLISPYRKDRDACRAMFPDKNFIEVFMNMPLELCEARDAKGLYKLARAGKIRGFTGIDDPYERPLNCEIELQQKEGICPAPGVMVAQVVSYLNEQGYLQDFNPNKHSSQSQHGGYFPHQYGVVNPYGGFLPFPQYTGFAPYPHPPKIDSCNFRTGFEASSKDQDSQTPFPPVSISESQIPPFSAQEGSDNAENNKRMQWSMDDDGILISAWLKFSKDPVANTDHKMKSFWKQIAEYYNQYRSSDVTRRRRPWKQCKSHWHKIKLAVIKFNKCCIRVTEQYPSKWSNEQVVMEAHQLYKSENNLFFRYEHAWKLLKDETQMDI